VISSLEMKENNAESSNAEQRIDEGKSIRG
jgi:hypothetical protein